MIKKPTVEDLYQLWLKGRGQPFGEFCYDAGIQHAREEMAQKRGPRPENPYDGSFRHEGTAWDIGFADAIAWADSGRPDPAPASEELVERIAQLLKELSYKQRPGDGTWSGDARAVLAEIAKSAHAATEAGNVIGWIARAVDAEKTISTLEAQLKEAQTHEEDWQRRALDYESCWKKAIAQARAQIETLEARVKELEAERESDHKLHESQADIIAKVAAELATARERVKELEGELATVKWDRECLQKTRDRLEEEELATAREQHRAEVEELKADLRSANTVIDSTQSKLAETQRELASSRDRAESYRAQFAYEKDEHSATRAQLAVRDEELDRLIGLVEKTGHGRVNDYWREIHDMIDAHRAKVGEFPVELGKRAHALLEQEDRAKASQPPGEQKEAAPSPGQESPTSDQRRQSEGQRGGPDPIFGAVNDEGPPRVGDVVRLLRISEWHNRYGGGVHSVGTEGMAAIVAESDGNGGVPRGETCVHFDNTSGGTWGVWEVIRRAQPSPVASDPSGDKCTMCVGSGEIARDLSGLLERCPACNGTGKESSAAMPLKGGRGPHIGSALDAAHMAETGCVVAPGEAHDCPAVYPGEQADARALVEEFVAERKAAADLDRPPGGHGPHHDEIAELRSLTEELCKGIGRLEEFARLADRPRWESVCRSCRCPMLSPASRERGGK